ncbi:MAG: hypothetical protein BMS9Abin14_277 [Gammaproteobacteria bacterium]|nr:MAG: hypothetical protein BMS9Abin14_277 [Gammaproteobacteria bacterium]
MKLGSLESGGRDGTLVVVAADLQRAVAVPDHAPTLQAALDDWQRIAPGLENVYACLNADASQRLHHRHSAALSPVSGALRRAMIGE